MSYDEMATHLWASEEEILALRYEETRPEFDFRIYDETDNGEFMTTAKVDLLVRGKVVHTESFAASSEDAPGPVFSAYGNGRDNHAGTLARSFAWAWIESVETPLEVRLAPFGPEWMREMLVETQERMS